MHHFDVIIGIDLLHSCYSYMDFHSRVVIFRFPNEEELIWERYNSSRPYPVILNLKAYKMMSKGLLCNLLSFND